MLYPPPLNFLTIPLLVVSPSSSMMKSLAFQFRLLFFWAENLFLVFGHFCYFLCLTPIIFMKIAVHIVFKMYGLKNKVT